MAAITETRVWQLAEREGWSLRELARRMGVSAQYLSDIRHGRYRMGNRFIAGARRAFPGYPLDWLFPEDPLTRNGPEVA